MIGEMLRAVGRLFTGSHGQDLPIAPSQEDVVTIAGHIGLGDFQCEICGHWRHNSLIEVMHLPIRGLEQYFPADRRNLRYCINPKCIQEAHLMRIAAFSTIDWSTEEDTND